VTTFRFLVVVGVSGLSAMVNKPARDTPNTNFTAASSNGDYVDLCKFPAISSFAQVDAMITACENEAEYFQFLGVFQAACACCKRVEGFGWHVDGTVKRVSNLNGKV
jgi:hypothetical protein